jgi:hypothetical protein
MIHACVELDPCTTWANGGEENVHIKNVFCLCNTLVVTFPSFARAFEHYRCVISWVRRAEGGYMTIRKVEIGEKATLVAEHTELEDEAGMQGGSSITSVIVLSLMTSLPFLDIYINQRCDENVVFDSLRGGGRIGASERTLTWGISCSKHNGLSD